MQRMHPALAGHRPAGGDQRLRGDLAAEHPHRRHLRRDAAVQVVLESLQVQQLDQAVDDGLPARNAVDVQGDTSRVAGGGQIVTPFTVSVPDRRQPRPAVLSPGDRAGAPGSGWWSRRCSAGSRRR